jgi:tRNA (guanine-N7-)-methyltransferase
LIIHGGIVLNNETTPNPLQNNNPEKIHRAIKSFVKRTGRITASQKNGWNNHWKDYGLDHTAGTTQYQQLCDKFNHIVVEIGYGMGDSLIQMAKQNIDTGFVGIEVHTPGVGSLLNNININQLSNIYSYCADAKEVLNQCITNSSIDRIQIFFPDPWHKKKHKKRRLISNEFIEHIVTKLKPSGIIHLATDWEDYALQMLEVLTSCDAISNTATNNQFVPRPQYRPETKFERRGISLGHKTWDLVFSKNSN